MRRHGHGDDRTGDGPIGGGVNLVRAMSGGVRSGTIGGLGGGGDHNRAPVWCGLGGGFDRGDPGE